VHHVNSVIIIFASVQIFREKLFTEIVDSRSEFLSKLSVLLRVKHAEFNLVHHGTAHRHDEGFAEF
jgi:hypothetical protein